MVVCLCVEVSAFLCVSDAKQEVNLQLNIKHVLRLQHVAENKQDSFATKIKTAWSPGSVVPKLGVKAPE